MSESDQFRQYAEEALLWAAQSITKEKQLLLELVCTWTQAAVASERTVTGPVVNLMEALRRSVETQRTGGERRKPAPRAGDHPAPKKAGRSSARAKKAG